MSIHLVGTRCLVCGGFIAIESLRDNAKICDECREAILEMKKMLKEKKTHPTISEIADKLKKCKDNVEEHGKPIQVDSHTLVWAEYWLRWAMEQKEKKDE